jgi:MFS family permease
MANGIGRRWSIIINLIIYTLGAAFMTGASGTAGVGLVYTGRLLTGWAVGASSMITPIYVAECSPAHIRGRLIGLYEVGVQFGTMVCSTWSSRLLSLTARLDFGFHMRYYRHKRERSSGVYLSLYS